MTKIRKILNFYKRRKVFFLPRPINWESLKRHFKLILEIDEKSPTDESISFGDYITLNNFIGEKDDYMYQESISVLKMNLEDTAQHLNWYGLVQKGEEEYYMERIGADPLIQQTKIGWKVEFEIYPL